LYKFLLQEVNQMKSWSDIGFEIEITGDSSPSLRLLTSVDPTKYRGESMHHSGGACAETLLIYGKPINEVLRNVEKPHFLIVGLGLGYIEMAIAREALLLGMSAHQVGLITSYESVPELREFFFQWLWDQHSVLAQEVWDVYESVAQHILADTTLTVGALKEFLKVHFLKLEDIQGALSAEVKPLSKYHCILYDAFSSKTSPFLWEEEFLFQFLQEGAADKCQVSTYACKASLKRALKRLSFEVIVREGFQGKRNSTLGIRN
jgi:hypothetical protein